MIVPWTRVKSWHCTACGKCCMEYRVPLRFYEYLKLKSTGFVEEKGTRFYIRKIGNKCPFQIGRLCSLQGPNKPLACKLYPFKIRERGEEEAEFEYKGEIFYVYVDVSTCPNIVLGKPTSMLKNLITEAIQIYLGEKRKLELITAKF